ncbi:MAG: hypothetical protein IAG13_27570 [Deltaproteobacteria bacterium]|nr:hypothetical protein [Nannocystaceae bacterium]
MPDPADAIPTVLDVQTRSSGAIEEVEYRLAVGDEESWLTLQRSSAADTIFVRDADGDVTAAAMRSDSGLTAVIDGERMITQGPAPLELGLEAEAALDPVARALLLADTVGKLPPAGLDPQQFTFVRDDKAGRATEVEPRAVRVFIGPDGGCIYWDTPQGGFDFVCWENELCC